MASLREVVTSCNPMGYCLRVNYAAADLAQCDGNAAHTKCILSQSDHAPVGSSFDAFPCRAVVREGAARSNRTAKIRGLQTRAGISTIS